MSNKEDIDKLLEVGTVLDPTGTVQKIREDMKNINNQNKLQIALKMMSIMREKQMESKDDPFHGKYDYSSIEKYIESYIRNYRDVAKEIQNIIDVTINKTIRELLNDYDMEKLIQVRIGAEALRSQLITMKNVTMRGGEELERLLDADAARLGVTREEVIRLAINNPDIR